MANKITVTSAGTTANVNATPDSARYYSDKSKEWAISDKLIDNEDYSSKYYANESKKQADISTAKTTEVVESGNTAVSNIASARDNAITDITNQENLSVDNVNTASATQISNVNTAGSTQVANVNSAGTTQINLAKEQVTLATNQANIATEQATIATNKTSEVVASGNTALSNITTAKNNAITSITNQETTSKNNVITTGNEQVERVNLTGVDNKTPIFSKNEIETNEGVYQNVYDLKHSTFDLSKFAVVGSPTITDDGVASGFSSWKYLTTTQSLGNSIKVCSTFKTPLNNNVTNNSAVWYMHTSTTIELQVVNQKMFIINSAGIITAGNFDFEYDTWYDTIFEYNFTTGAYKLSYKKSVDNNYIELTGTQSGWVNMSLSDIVIDFGAMNRYYYFTGGSIDLKQFSITVDGKEVFNGNKTGIDVIKPDNYTVVGSPTISDDGVASGFSTNSYIRKTTNISAGPEKNIIIYAKCTWNGVIPSSNACVLGGTTANAPSVYLNTSGKWFFNLLNIAGGTLETAQIGDNYLKFELKNSVWHYSFSTDGASYIEIGTQAGSDFNNWILNIGQNLYTTSVDRPYTAGSIDLNAFKIYVDGNLVYQPCLKIPYTESKTGSKIVDGVYRDRVIDLYEQEGRAGYYTIDEENKNFTLPMGEIYGMMGQRSLISSTVTETNRVDIYSDKTCLICGNVATAGTINLPIELVNNNYFITLSTSEKTATSFTTTATGDYILIGKVI